MKKGYTPAEIQADILNNYFNYIASTGYMDDARTSQLLTGVLLLDTIEFFADYIDKDYIEKIEKYLRKSRCCNCAIRLDKIITSQCKICPPSPEPTPEYVDLGLSVKWAKCNLGATTETEYGKYYAWGEIEEKAGWKEGGTKVPYNWLTYKYANGAANKLTKYCDNASYGDEGYTDDLTILEKSDDAAAVTYGSGWRMPTVDEMEELITLRNEWIEDYHLSGVNGILFTANNGNTLFLPAGGVRFETDLRSLGEGSSYWASSLAGNNYVNSAMCCTFNKNLSPITVDYPRMAGYLIRPVLDESTNTSQV